MSHDTASLWDRVARNPSPASFWSGVRLRHGLVPDNIVFFPRVYTEPPSSVSLGSYHPRYVLDVVLGGSGIIRVGSDWFLLREGEAVLIFPQQYHFGGAETGSRPFQLAVTTFDLEDDTAIRSLRSAPRRLRAQDRARFGSLIDAWNTKADGVEISARLSACLKGLCDAPAAERRVVSPPADSTDAARGELIETIIRLQNTGAGDTVAELAAAMGLTQALLRDRFRQYSGHSLPEFLRNRRLERAVRLLEDPRLSIGEIAGRLRFSSVQTFSRIFKERYGVSPREYEAAVQRNLGDPR